MNKSASDLLKKVEEAKKSKKTVVFLAGTCSDGNKWREEVKKMVGEKFCLLDPFDKNWDAEDNIYDELAGISLAGFVIFYKPGKLSEKEKKFIDLVKGADKYKEFDTVDEIVSFLDAFKVKEPISSKLRKMARAMERMAMPWGMSKGNLPVDFHVEDLDNESVKNLYQDLSEGKVVTVPIKSDGKYPRNVDKYKVSLSDFDEPKQQELLRILKNSIGKVTNPNPRFMYDPQRKEYILK